MYANILQGPRGGELTKYIKPRFPVTHAELTRLANGITFTEIHDCQQAATPLTALVGDNANASGTTQYRKPLTGLQEFGAKTTDAIGGWVTGVDITPGADSFMLGCYFNFDTTFAPAIDAMYGLAKAGNAPPWVWLSPKSGNTYRARLQDAPGVAFDLTVTGVAPADKIARGWIILYDAATSVLYSIITGTATLQTRSMAGWAGFGANVIQMIIGGLVGWTGTDTRVRYGFYARGAQLNNYNTSLLGFHRRLGWN